MSFNDEETVEDLPISELIDDLTAESFEEGKLQVGALTHRGRVRTSNQDQYAVVQRTRRSVVLASSLDREEMPETEEHSWLLVVADGLGGHVSGEIASAAAMRAILNFGNNLGYWIMRPDEGLRNQLAQRVEAYAQAIQEELARQAKSNPELHGMATTITAAYLFGPNAVIVNVGDSRSYLIRANRMHQITRDHTLAEDLKAKGMSSQYTQPYRNLLTRCFDTGGNRVDFDIFQVVLQDDDRLLLCSDGLTDMVPDQAIQPIVAMASSPGRAVEQLAAAALTNGGRDNVTAVVARIRSVEQPNFDTIIA